MGNNSTSQKNVTFLTLNVLFKYDETRYTNIISLVLKSKFMLVAFQEVTPEFCQLLKANKQLMNLYEICCTTTRHDTALLVLNNLKPNFTQVPVKDRKEATDGKVPSLRNITIVEVKYGTKTLACATAHLESIFFTEEATSIKAKQITQITDILNSLKADHSFIMGDCNLTGNDFLELENVAIKDNSLTDLWLKLHPTNEDQRTEDWRKNHCTWDGANNSMVTYNEFHRPDRVLLLKNIDGISIERVIGNPCFSDHYGLSGVLKLV